MTTVFLSYARNDDEPFARRLHDDLETAGLDVWFDRLDMPSRALTFLQEIRDAISARDRLVLVVGPSALTSEYVEAEWRWAFEFGKPVNPILRLSDYADLPDELRLIDTPDFRDDAHYQERLETLVRQLSEPVPPMGKLVGVPSLPEHLLRREDRLRALKDAVLADIRRTAVVTGEPARVGVHGMSGIGKSVLAAMLARDIEVRRAFPDGVIWVLVGQQPNLPELLRSVAKALDDPGAFETAHEGKATLQDLLAERAVLLVLDDIWEVRHAEAFDALGPKCRMVITTRDASMITAIGGTEHQLQLPSEAEARHLLAQWANVAEADLPAEAEAVLEHCNRLPLAVSLCGALAREGMTWGDLAEALADADLVYLDHPHGSILRSIELSVDRLPEDEARRFAELRVFPPDETVPEAAVLTLWEHGGRLSERHARKLLNKLGQRALVWLDGVAPNRRVSLHDLVYDYTAQMVADETALHRELVEAYGAKCPEGWVSGPNDGYFLEHLREHMRAAGRAEEIVALCLDLRWLETKAEAGLVFDLPRDFEAGQAALSLDGPMRENLRLLEQALRNDLHFIARHPTTLFQCFWNSAWWYDCPEAEKHYDPPEDGWSAAGPPWERPEPKLCTPMERWRAEKEGRQPGFLWLRSLRPPPFPLGGAQVMCLRGHEHGVESVAFSPDGRRLASGGDNTVRVWDSESGTELACLRVHEGWAASVAFSPDGRRLALASRDVVSRDDTVRVWDAATGVELACLRGHEGRVNSVHFSPDGARLASGSDDETVRVWDTERWAEVFCLRGHRGPVESVVFSPCGQRLASASGRGVVFGTEGTIRDLRSDYTVRVWDTESSDEVACLRGHEAGLTSVAFSPDGTRLATGSYDRTVRVWDGASGAELGCLRGHESRVASVAFSPDGQRLASGSGDDFSRDDTVRVWDAATGVELACVRGHEGTVNSVIFSPDGARLASGSDDGTVRLWDMVTGPGAACLRSHDGRVTRVAFSPDGARVATGSDDRTVRVWDAGTGAEVACLRGHEAGLTSVAFSPDGTRLATGSDDRTVRVWDIGGGAEAACLRGHENWLTSVAFSPDGRRLASSDAHGGSTVRIWEAESGLEVACLRHAEEVLGVAFSPDGYRLASVDDWTVRIWDAESGRCLEVVGQDRDPDLVALLHAPGHEVHRVAFSPDGHRLASVDDSKTRIWDADTGECLEVFGDAGDAQAIAAGPSVYPWRALVRSLETTVSRASGGEAICCYPRRLWDVTTHASGRIWAGGVGNYLALFTLEGDPESGALD